MPNKYPEKKKPKTDFEIIKNKKKKNFYKLYQGLQQSATQQQQNPETATPSSENKNFSLQRAAATDLSRRQQGISVLISALTESDALSLPLSLSLRLYLLTIYIGFSAFVFLCKCIKLLIGSCLFSFPKSFCFCFWLFSMSSICCLNVQILGTVYQLCSAGEKLITLWIFNILPSQRRGILN